MNLPCTLLMLYNCYSVAPQPDRVFLADRRANDSPAGSELYASIPVGEDVVEREKKMLDWFAAGDFPETLTRFKAIQVNEAGHHLTYWVMPDYLALGNNEDFVLTPLAWTSIKKLVADWKVLVPTAKMVDQIYQRATHIHWPHAYPPSDEMRSIAYLLNHNSWIHERDFWDNVEHPLIAGHKKDLVVSPKLLQKPTKLAIYGWHNLGNGAAIQPQSLWHGQFYVDYSHGLRVVAPIAELDGKEVSLASVLRNPSLAPLISFEGAFDICEVLAYPCG